MRLRTALRVLCIAAAAVLLVGCSDTSRSDDTVRDEDGEIIEGGDVGAFRLQVGDCISVPPTGEVTSVEGVPCNEPHQFEAYHSYDIPGFEWPGQPAIDEIALDQCEAAFEPFVGRDDAQSIYDFSSLTPTEQSWNNLDDREVLCLLGSPDGALKTGSAEGSAL